MRSGARAEISMPTYHGLYHPFIHFQNEAWLKLTALYWDGIFRMVPETIVPDDSNEVRVLAESGFIGNRHPGMGAGHIAEPFRHLLSTRGEQLNRKYGVQPLTPWRTLDHIHLEKMDEKLVQELIAYRLGRIQGSWLGMQPPLTSVYMTALAEVMAPMIGARPIAEQSIDHIAVSGLTVERLSSALLGREEGPAVAQLGNDVETAMASLAISYVVPENAGAIPAKQIVQFRREFSEERAQFQTEIQKTITGLAHLKDVRNPADVKKHLKSEYDKNLGPKLARLKNGMTRIGWDTVDSTAAASFVLPQGIAIALQTLGFALTGGIATALGVAFCGWTVWRKREKAKADTLKPSSEAFLYRIEHFLKPEMLTDQVLTNSRTFLPYV
jgi:hypothetical protein